MASRVVRPYCPFCWPLTNSCWCWCRTFPSFIGNQVDVVYVVVAAPVVVEIVALWTPFDDEDEQCFRKRKNETFLSLTVLLRYSIFFRRELCWRCWTTAIKDRPSQAKRERLEGCGWVCVFSKRRGNERKREPGLSASYFSALWLVEINGGGTLVYVCTVFEACWPFFLWVFLLSHRCYPSELISVNYCPPSWADPRRALHIDGCCW